MQSFSASWPAWPNGVWPRSCASAIASTRSSLRPQGARDRAAELRHFERMREPRAEQVAFVVQEHLRLVDQPAKRRGVHDAVAVALELGARRRAAASAWRRPRDAPGRRRTARHGVIARACPRSSSALRPHASRAATSRTSASGAPRMHGACRARRSRTKRISPRLGLLVDAHQLQVAARAPSAGRHARAGRRAAISARQALHERRVDQPPSRCDSCAAITMPQPTASPCSHSP